MIGAGSGRATSATTVNGKPSPLRIGILGAARIAPHALIAPARHVAGVRVESIAARDGARAAAFAAKHAIPRWSTDYEALVEDPALDALYIPLPNGLHHGWTLRALAAGKHVLCEKPLAANAAQAQAMAEAAASSGFVLMEAFHNRYHPLLQRVGDIVCSGELGDVTHVEAIFRTPTLRREDIRFEYGLGGGATMDMGCYMINLLRLVLGDELEVTEAQPWLMAPQVDRRMVAHFRTGTGASARMDVEMKALRLPDVRLVVHGTQGALRVVNPVLPHLYHSLRVKSAAGVRREHFGRNATSYAYQLAAFVAGVREGAPILTDGADAVRNMRIIDAVYAKAGMQARGVDGDAHR